MTARRLSGRQDKERGKAAGIRNTASQKAINDLGEKREEIVMASKKQTHERHGMKP